MVGRDPMMPRFPRQLKELAWLKVIVSRKSQRKKRSRLLLPRRAKRARLRAASRRSDRAKRNRTHGSFDESWTLTPASNVMLFSNRVSERATMLLHGLFAYRAQRCHWIR